MVNGYEKKKTGELIPELSEMRRRTKDEGVVQRDGYTVGSADEHI